MVSSARSRRARFSLAAALVGVCALLGALVAFASESRVTSLVSTGSTTGGGGAAEFEDASEDGSRIFFTAEERLVAADTDESVDVYERAGGVTTLVSIGPAGGNGASDAERPHCSADGSVVYFETDEALVAADTDTATDIYMRSGGTVELASVGTAGNGPGDVDFGTISADGSKLFFVTADALVPGDEDAVRDIYERDGETTTLVTPETATEVGLTYLSVSDDGTHVFFSTNEKLVGEDTDSNYDIYERTGGEFKLISIGPEGGNGAINAPLSGVSADGTRAIFRTNESLVEADEDSVQDIYVRAAKKTSLLTLGTEGAGNEAIPVIFGGIDAEANHLFFETAESLLPADTDEATDVYDRSAGGLALVSPGSGAQAADFVGSSADGSHAYFETTEALVAADTDAGLRDVYVTVEGVTSLVSTGTGEAEARYEGASADGARAFFRTSDRADSADTDSETDVYQLLAGELTLVSIGPEGGNAEEGAYFEWATPDGSRVVFSTAEQLVAADDDADDDVYLSEPGTYPPPPSEPPQTETPPGEGGSESPPASTPLCMGKKATIVGTGKGEVLKGTRKRDVIVARGGNDKVFGYAGNDLICAGDGKDTVKAGSGKDKVNAGAAADKVYGQDGDDKLYGQGGPDLLFGNPGRDLLNGGANNRDRCRPGPGKDKLTKCER